MFILKKAITPFLVPPGVFIAVLIISGLWFILKKFRKAGVLQVVIGCAMWFFSTGPVSTALLSGLELSFPATYTVTGDVIILLGGGIDDTADDLNGKGVPSQENLERIVTAVRLQKRLGVPILATGGGFRYQMISESDVTKRYLMDLGVPAHFIIVESKSRNSIENARFSSEICRKAGYKHPILVTSGYHLKRALFSFQKVHMTVTPFPADGRSRARERFVWTDILPTDYRATYLAVKEYIGLVFYRLVY